ncbi:hypothetical protein [Aeriscardovia aeriphila]|uniref:Colicin transporter n=1 Tax=Aeriscardovia aeriphila TaxID=218139 RepID=A0A261FBW8_9BIFI|nr:hypothetical protein [Aeriscardovia aeriphila]NYI25311.1 colicin import membrane protein [Aeriscardovia aeriphila]OZG56535.1 colicin transporter [Aeriscardovia aeriphila]
MNEEETPTPQVNTKKKRTILIASIAAGVLVLAGGITGGVYAYHQHEHSQAVSACVKTVTPLQNALTNLHTQQSAKATTELVKLDVKKLADKTTHTTLATAVKPVSVTVASCASTLNTAQLRVNAGKNKRAFTRVKTATANLTSAVDKLVASRTLQSRNLLTAEVKAGQQLVKDSQGKVQDQKTLDQLNTVLTASNKLAQDKTADSTKLDKQLDELKKAEQAVRDSVEAKRKADEEAARKAEEERQAQAAAAAAQQAQTYRAQTYRAPAQSYRAPVQTYRAPAPSAPQNNGGGTTKRIGGNEGSIYKSNGNLATPEDGCRIVGFCN